jgi:hypothetical protein
LAEKGEYLQKIMEYRINPYLPGGEALLDNQTLDQLKALGYII